MVKPISVDDDTVLKYRVSLILHRRFGEAPPLQAAFIQECSLGEASTKC